MHESAHNLGIVPVVAAAALFSDYRVRRLTAFLDPWADREDSGYQLVQSLIAVGSGGLTGNGLGYSVQKLGFLPYPHTDFIYAVVGEELGLVGASVLLVCFCVITWRGLKTASRAPDARAAIEKFQAFLRDNPVKPGRKPSIKSLIEEGRE